MNIRSPNTQVVSSFSSLKSRTISGLKWSSSETHISSVICLCVSISGRLGAISSPLIRPCLICSFRLHPCDQACLSSLHSCCLLTLHAALQHQRNIDTTNQLNFTCIWKGKVISHHFFSTHQRCNKVCCIATPERLQT